MQTIPKFDTAAYAAKLAQYLSAWKPTIKAHVLPHPILWHYRNGNKETRGKNYVIEITITQSLLSDKKVVVEVVRDERELNLDETRLWHDAYSVQDDYYKKLQLPKGDLKSSRYWQLWDELKSAVPH